MLEKHWVKCLALQDRFLETLRILLIPYNNNMSQDNTEVSTLAPVHETT